MESASALVGRRIAVTGAGRGLGRALAIVAADRGADLVLLGRDLVALRAVAETIEERTGRGALIVPCDIAKPDSIREACRTVLAETPAIDVLVNNAAPWLPGELAGLGEMEVATTIAAAVTGTILVTKGLLPGLQRSTGADIVTIVSTAGWTGWDTVGASAVFHAAKHGQSGFSDGLRHELKEHGIRVAAIYPPDFDDADPAAADWSNNDVPAVPGRLTNREVVAAVMFVITAPRACACPVIILDHMGQ